MVYSEMQNKNKKVSEARPHLLRVSFFQETKLMLQLIGPKTYRRDFASATSLRSNSAEAKSRVCVEQVGQSVSPHPSKKWYFFSSLNPYKPPLSLRRGFVALKKFPFIKKQPNNNRCCFLNCYTKFTVSQLGLGCTKTRDEG